MHGKILAFVFVVVIAFHNVEAAEVCVTVDTSNWTDAQKHVLAAHAYWLAYNVGNDDNFPRVKGNNVCFDNPKFNVAEIITTEALLDHIKWQEAEDELHKDKAAAYKQELKQLNAELDALGGNWDVLTLAQKGQFTKKLFRIRWLERQLGVR